MAHIVSHNLQSSLSRLFRTLKNKLIMNLHQKFPAHLLKLFIVVYFNHRCHNNVCSAALDWRVYSPTVSHTYQGSSSCSRKEFVEFSIPAQKSLRYLVLLGNMLLVLLPILYLRSVWKPSFNHTLCLFKWAVPILCKTLCRFTICNWKVDSFSLLSFRSIFYFQ